MRYFPVLTRISKQHRIKHPVSLKQYLRLSPAYCARLANVSVEVKRVDQLVHRRQVLGGVGTVLVGSVAGCSSAGDDGGSDTDGSSDTSEDTETSGSSDTSENSDTGGGSCGPGSTRFDENVEMNTEVTVTGVVTDINTGRQLLLVDDTTARGGVLLLGDAPDVENYSEGDCITATGEIESTVAVQADVKMLVNVGDDRISKESE